jgi:hypothetical protein
MSQFLLSYILSGIEFLRVENTDMSRSFPECPESTFFNLNYKAAPAPSSISKEQLKAY